MSANFKWTILLIQAQCFPGASVLNSLTYFLYLYLYFYKFNIIALIILKSMTFSRYTVVAQATFYLTIRLVLGIQEICAHLL